MRSSSKLVLVVIAVVAAFLALAHAQQSAAAKAGPSGPTTAKSAGVYLIGLIDIHDRTAYEKYIAGFRAIFERYKGELLVVEEKATVLEGDWPFTRTVIIRFPDEAEAKRWYDSEDYQNLAKIRFGAARSKIVLAKGRL
jgi:uncharacterized protein (DUF1330 family)